MKKGFTLLEIIFVIVIIGILSSVLLPRFTRPTLQEAANQIISHIQYTQHLAMIDNKFDPNYRLWYRLRWQIMFGKSKNNSGKDTDGEWAYTIFSDTENTHQGKPGPSEMAENPLKKGELLSGGYSGELDWEDERATKEMNLGKKYNIKKINFSGCGGQRMAFDNIGRPMSGNTASWVVPYPIGKILAKPCNIILTNGDSKSITIRIESETGYSHVLK
jgi:prepilin-type N-terminal cleavage/methylation domain-containing protein